MLNLQVNENIFDMPPGSLIDLQVSYPVQVRLKLQLVGYEIGQYIILKYPPTARDADYKDVFSQGNVVIARYIIEGNKGQCCAFRSTIRHLTLYPERFLFLDYPTEIENRDLRMHQRHITHLPAFITLDTESLETDMKIKGIINDISSKGCGFVFKGETTQINVKECEVLVCIPTPTNGLTKIRAKVRNSRNELGKVNVGIQFYEEDRQVADLFEHLFIEDELAEVVI